MDRIGFLQQIKRDAPEDISLLDSRLKSKANIDILYR